MLDQALVGKLIDVAVRGHSPNDEILGSSLDIKRFLGWRFGNMPTSQRYSRSVTAIARNLGSAPIFMLPCDKIAFVISCGADLHQHGGSLGLPGEFILTHPLNPYRTPRHRQG